MTEWFGADAIVCRRMILWSIAAPALASCVRGTPEDSVISLSRRYPERLQEAVRHDLRPSSIAPRIPEVSTVQARSDGLAGAGATALPTPSGFMTMGNETYGEEADGIPWRPFVASGGGLKIDLPSDPTEQNATLRTSVGTVKVHGFRAEHDGVVYLAAYSECHARLDLSDYEKVLDAPLDEWVPGARRRKRLGERLLMAEGPGGPREVDFALPSGKDGGKRIARRRWIDRQPFIHQAIVVMPERRAASADVVRFLGSLEAVPIALDRRGLTPTWKRTGSQDDGFSILWPRRLDDWWFHVEKAPTRSVWYRTDFVLQESTGFAITVVRYGPPSIFWLDPAEFRMEAAEAMDEVRDRFLSEYQAQLLDERLIHREGLAGREFEARFTGAAKGGDKSRPYPPGPGVRHVRARLYMCKPRVFLVYVTTPDGQETHRGAETFLDSFRPADL